MPPKIELKPVISTLASHVGFDAASGTLAVRHHDGSEYHYHGVHPIQYAELMRSKSLGTYMHQNIRGKKKHTQVK